MERKLTAIFSADVKGYSRLMGDDEEATIRTLTSYREVMTTLIQQHRGRVVDSPGDNLLAEFASAVDAVQGAVEIQRALKVKNTELPDERKMHYRIGLNVGDVIVEGERLYGDGVNIAARLEGLAEPGGICVSGTVYDQVENKLALGYEYVGEQEVKNITKSVRVWRIQVQESSGQQSVSPQSTGEKPTLRRVRPAYQIGAGLVLLAALMGAVRYFAFPTPDSQSLIPSTQSLAPSPQAAPAALPLPDKPSIAVLPFTNMSGDPEQEYFSDGITEDLITDFSKISGLFVIARNSTFVYKGKAVKIKEVSQELGVRYVLEGSVRRADNKVRITAQLVDATTGHHVWAERYDRPLQVQDIFALQDEIRQKIVGALQVKLTAGEQGRLERVPTDNLEAYDAFLRGLESLHRSTHETHAQARQLFERAIALDPQFAAAYAALSWTHFLGRLNQWSQDPQTPERAFALAQQAVALDDSLPMARIVLSYVYLFIKKQPEQVVAEAERAVALAPNDADVCASVADILSHVGRTEEAIELMEKAMRLNPHYPSGYLHSLGVVYAAAKRYEEAISAYERALTRNPNYLLTHLDLAHIYSELGREVEARAAAAEVRRLSPDFLLEALRQVLPATDQAGVERYLASLRKAGLQ